MHMISPAPGAMAATVVLPPRRPGWYRAARVSFALLPLLSVHLALAAIPFVPLTLGGVVLLFVMTRVSGVGITVGFHRGLSHHAYKTSRWFQFLLSFAGCTAFQRGPLWWALFHRIHHQHSDTEGDVHSPVVKGFWYSHCGWLFTRYMLEPDFRMVRDLTKHPELVWLDRLWMVPGMLVAAGVYLAGGWSWLIYGYCLSTVMVFQVTFAVNSIGHLFGSQRYATGEGSRNNWVLGILGMGDGWHNNHHRVPTSARHGFAWYEVDVAYRFICLFRRLGLVWGVRVPPAEVMAVATGKHPTPAPVAG
ncbi:MAG: Fatty acid desaturase [Gemmataceae bacterium]|nr:Fatty acid desaturase [Gemmataceae bacterium]